MPDLQEIFNRIQEKKKEQKDIKAAYRDALDNSKQYKDLVEELNTLRAKKKQFEEDTKKEFSGEISKLESIKDDLASDRMLLSDLALTTLMKGEKVEITDAYENKYEPIFSVQFKKV